MTLARPNNPVRIAASVALAERYGDDVMMTAYDQLKPSERIFVDVFIATDSPAEAIRKAMPNLAQNVVNVRAMDMLKRPLVKAAIADRIKRITDKYEVTAEKVVRELAKVGFANMADYIRITPEGEPFVDMSELDHDQMAAIKSVKVEDYKEGRGDDARDIRKVTFELHDKLAGLDKLAKHLGIYAPQGVSLTGPNGGPLQIEARTVTVDMTPEQAAEYYQRSLEVE